MYRFLWKFLTPGGVSLKFSDLSDLKILITQLSVSTLNFWGVLRP
jgi:hypothetical protein